MEILVALGHLTEVQNMTVHSPGDGHSESVPTGVMGLCLQ